MRWAVHVASILGVLWTPSATWAEPPSQTQLVALLSDYESMPDARVFVAHGATTADLLFQIYAAKAQPTFVRVRALRAFSYFPADISATRLQNVLTDPHAPSVLTREAANGLVRCLGEAAVPPVATLLRRPDPQLRRMAIEVLAQVGNAQVRSTFVAHRAVEVDPDVRGALDAALLHIGPTP